MSVLVCLRVVVRSCCCSSVGVVSGEGGRRLTYSERANTGEHPRALAQFKSALLYDRKLAIAAITECKRLP